MTKKTFTYPQPFYKTKPIASFPEEVIAAQRTNDNFVPSSSIIAPSVPVPTQLINPAAYNFFSKSQTNPIVPVRQVLTQQGFTPVPIRTAVPPVPFTPQGNPQGLRDNKVPTQVSLPNKSPTNSSTPTPSSTPSPTKIFVNDMSYEQWAAAHPELMKTPTLLPGQSWLQDFENSQQTATAEMANPKGVVTQTPWWIDYPPTMTVTPGPSRTALPTRRPTATSTPSPIPTYSVPPNGFQTATPEPFKIPYPLDGLRENRVVSTPKPKSVDNGYGDFDMPEMRIPKTAYSGSQVGNSTDYSVTNPQRYFEFIKDNGMRDQLTVDIYDVYAPMIAGNKTESKYDDLIKKIAIEAGINPVVLKSVVAYESGFVGEDEKKIGVFGVSGHAQVSDKATTDVNNTYHLYDTDPTSIERWDPKIGIRLGAYYLKKLLGLPQINGNIQKAIGLYNGGPYTYVDPKTGEETTPEQKLASWWEPRQAQARGFDFIRKFQGLNNVFTEETGGLKGGINKEQGQIRFGVQSSRPEVPMTAQSVMPAAQTTETIPTAPTSTFLNLDPNYGGVNLQPLSTLISQAGDVQVSANVNGVLEQLVNEWQQTEKYTIQVVEGFRTGAKQDEYYKIGRGEGDTRKQVTKAKAGQSQHQTGYAFDIMFYDDKGNIIDSNNAMLQPLHKKFQTMASRYGVSHPLAWDTPHYVASQTLLDEASATLSATEQGKLMIQELEPKIRNGTITNSELNSILQLAYGVK